MGEGGDSHIQTGVGAAVGGSVVAVPEVQLPLLASSQIKLTQQLSLALRLVEPQLTAFCPSLAQVEGGSFLFS